MKIETDQDLGETDNEEGIEPAPSERKVLTQPVDLSVQTLVEQWEDKMIVLPTLQREYLWDNAKSSRLIESLLLNIPIPVVYFAETEDAKYEVIDGHQRVHSISRYLNNEFGLNSLAVLHEYKGLRFRQLPEKAQRFIKMRTLRVIIISIDSHPRMKFEIFERLNSGSIALNAQELRNAIYGGTFNNLIRELVKDVTFRKVIGTKTPRKRMVDEELILRFFAFEQQLDRYRPSLKTFLNDFMRSNKAMSADTVDAFRERFLRTLRVIFEAIGPTAFRLIEEDGRPVENPINRAIVDAQMLAASWVTTPNPAEFQANCLVQIARMNKLPNFLDSIRRATGDRSRTITRVRMTAEAFEAAGLELDIPFDLAG